MRCNVLIYSDWVTWSEKSYITEKWLQNLPSGANRVVATRVTCIIGDPKMRVRKVRNSVLCVNSHTSLQTFPVIKQRRGRRMRYYFRNARDSTAVFTLTQLVALYIAYLLTDSDKKNNQNDKHLFPHFMPESIIILFVCSHATVGYCRLHCFPCCQQ